jgi:hypothetical protein
VVVTASRSPVSTFQQLATSIFSINGRVLFAKQG